MSEDRCPYCHEIVLTGTGVPTMEGHQWRRAHRTCKENLINERREAAKRAQPTGTRRNLPKR